MRNLTSITQQIDALNEKRRRLIAANARRAKKHARERVLAVGAAVVAAVDSGLPVTIGSLDDLSRLVDGHRRQGHGLRSQTTPACDLLALDQPAVTRCEP